MTANAERSIHETDPRGAVRRHVADLILQAHHFSPGMLRAVAGSPAGTIEGETMTPKEVQAEVNALRKAVGPRSDVFISINAGSKHAIDLSIYPNGLCNQPRLFIEADDWSDVLRMARERWAAASEGYRVETIRAAHALGHNRDWIARRLGRTPGSIDFHMRQIGLIATGRAPVRAKKIPASSPAKAILPSNAPCSPR
jgi:hypothetical protein